MSRTTTLIGVVVVALVLGGCTGGSIALQLGTKDSPPVPADLTGRVAVDPTEPLYPPPTTAVPVPNGSAGSDAGRIQTVAVVDVQIDHSGGADRIVYGFSGHGMPFWKVGYVAEAVPRGGDPSIPVLGRAIMQVDIMGTAPHPDPRTPAYDASHPLTGPDQSRVTQLFLLPGTVDADDVATPEVITQSFIGLTTDPAPFEVTTVADPPRLIIEIR